MFNTTYHVDLVAVNALSIKRFDTKVCFGLLSEEKKKEIKQYIRDLVINEDNISNAMIDNTIFVSLMEKKVQERLVEFKSI